MLEASFIVCVKKIIFPENHRDKVHTIHKHLWEQPFSTHCLPGAMEPKGVFTMQYSIIQKEDTS